MALRFLADHSVSDSTVQPYEKPIMKSATRLEAQSGFFGCIVGLQWPKS
jgi:hypothetical protein